MNKANIINRSASTRTQTLLRALGFVGVALTGMLVMNTTASADLSTCSRRSGSMRFWDRETNACGYVSGTNANWSSFGWNDRADEFGNDGTTHSVCIYKDSSYRGGGVFLRRGYAVTWRNIVSSNRWTTGSGC